MKYMILDTIIHISYIFQRSPNRSPLVQSGDISQDARIIAGDTRKVKAHKSILRISIALFHLAIVPVLSEFVDLFA